jgi:hypothetical protein
MFKKKIIKTTTVEKIFNLKNKFINKLNFIKNKKNGGSPDSDKNKTKKIVLNFENLFM